MAAEVEKLKFEYVNPNNIESEVPGEQTLREAITLTDATNNEAKDGATYKPVITVTKKEEPIARYNNPMYSEVTSEVIVEPRVPRRDVDDQKENESNSEKDKDQNGNGPGEEIVASQQNGKVNDNAITATPSEKPKSRIPKLKEAVSKIKRNRKVSDEKRTKEDRKPTERSFEETSKIPKLGGSAISEKENKPANHETNSAIAPVEEEFDKLYDEITEQEHLEESSVDTELILENLVIDPNKVENKFEEIIHEYEENKIEPLSLDTINAVKSRIPVLRRRSEQEVAIPKSYVRSLSHKYDLAKKDKNTNGHNDIIQKSLQKDTVEKRTKIFASPDESNSFTISRAVSQNESHLNKPEDRKDVLKRSRSSIVDRFFNTGTAKSNNVTSLPDEVKSEEQFTKINKNLEASLAVDDVVQPIVINEDTGNEDKYSKNSNEVHSVKPALDNDVELCEISQSEQSITDPELEAEKVTESTEQLTEEEDSERITIENDTVKYNVINKPNDISVSKESINIIEDKEIIQKNNGVENEINEEELPVQGKVSRVISRLSSQDVVDETPKPIITCKVTKNTSMMSKIALFENPEQVTNIKNTSKIPITRRMSKEIKTAPKIIDEVLKPRLEHKKIENVYDGNLANDNDHEENVLNVELPNNNIINTNKSNFDDKIETTVDNEIILNEITSPLDNSYYVDNPATEISINNPDNLNVATPCDDEDVTPTIKDIEETRKIDAKKIPDIPNVNNYELYNQLNVQSEKGNYSKGANEGPKYKRAKSVVEIDLGDSINGKVSEIIRRISSTECLNVDVPRKELISKKEMPRRKSVSEKIALFERKIVPVEIKDDIKGKSNEEEKQEPANTQEDISPEIEARIAELAKAKLRYGRSDTRTYIRLRDGTDMPALFFGTALLQKALIVPLVKAAIDLGYRGIDCAYLYGNQKEIGEAIYAKIKDGTVTRQDLYITSKLWGNSHRTDLVEKACRESLDAMGLDYFDLYLIHYPVSFKEGVDPVPRIAKVIQHSIYDYMDAWRGMESLVTKGLVRSIGVSNFNSVQIRRVFEKSKIKPVVNQVECHPYLNQIRLEDVCSQYDIVLCSYGSLGSVGSPAEYRSAMEPVLYDPVVIAIAKELGITPAQVLIRYQTERGHVAIVKASSAARLAENLRSLDVQLKDIHVHKLNLLNRNKRYFDFKKFGDTHKNYPFHIAF